MEVLMLKLSLKPGEYITLGDNIKIIFSGGSANNIHLLVDAPREINVARNSAGKDKKPSPYHITFRRNRFRGTHTCCLLYTSPSPRDTR